VEPPSRLQLVNIAGKTLELAARIRELAGQEPKLHLRRIEQRLRRVGFDVSSAAVRRVLRR